METATKLFDARVGELLILLQNAITDYGPEAWELTALGIKADVVSDMFMGGIWTIVIVTIFGVIIPNVFSRSRMRSFEKDGKVWDTDAIFFAIWFPRIIATAVFFVIGSNTWMNIKMWMILIEPKLYLVYKTLGMI